MSIAFICYAIALLLFAGLDIVWLMVMGPALYKPVLGDILAPEVRIGPALAFYALFPIGLAVFAILPALKADSLGTALAFGALFGILTYATYDLTNFATLRNWTLQLTVIDITYGGIVAAAISGATFLLAPALAGMLGIER